MSERIKGILADDDLLTQLNYATVFLSDEQILKILKEALFKSQSELVFHPVNSGEKDGTKKDGTKKEGTKEVENCENDEKIIYEPPLIQPIPRRMVSLSCLEKVENVKKVEKVISLLTSNTNSPKTSGPKIEPKSSSLLQPILSVPILSLRTDGKLFDTRDGTHIWEPPVIHSNIPLKFDPNFDTITRFQVRHLMVCFLSFFFISHF